MIIEERNYSLVPGGVHEYIRRWEEHGRGPQIRHLGEPLGVYTTEVGELNTLVYLWTFESMGDRAARRAALAADPDFADFRKGVRGLMLSQRNRLLMPAISSQTKDDR